MTSVATSQPLSSASSAPSPRVNTKTARRRLVSYRSLADIEADLAKVDAAHRAGTLRRLGNHDAGPLLAHLAMAMRCSFDGFPARAPSWIRWLGPLLKNRILARPFEPGLNLRSDAESVAWNDAITYDNGLAQLRAQIARARQPGAQPAAAHPFFGPLTPAQWATYHLRHAELHMSFLQV